MHGCHKKMIYMRNTGSEIFDEAFFVLKPGFDTNKTSESDMIREAKRILELEKGGEVRMKKPKTNKWKLVLCEMVCAVLLLGSIILLIAVI